jgi:gliding motility-associated-like protein
MPVASFIVGKESPVFVNEDTVYFNNQSVGANKYSWMIPSLTTDSGFNFHYTFTYPGKYKIILKATDSTTGCESITDETVEVKIHEAVYVPNAFTPNDDGNNDQFFISLLNVQECELLIFNRWGEIIIRSTDLAFKWDGKLNGVPAPPDVYGYIVSGRGIDSEFFSTSGTFTLLR